MIGIVGGMGAAAGVHLFDMLIQEQQRRGARADMDFREALLYNLPATGLNEKGIADENRMRLELLSAISLLNKAGSRFILIACNSVHIYREMLQRRSDALILDMVASAVRACIGCKKVGVVSSHTTRDNALYHKAITTMLGAECLEVSDYEQGAIDGIIGNIISGTACGRHEIAMQSMISDLIQAGAEKIILGCTELPLLPLSFNHGIIVDPAREVVQEVLSL